MAEGEVAQAGVGEELEGFLELGVGGEELGGGLDVEIENIADGESVVTDFQGGGIVALAEAAFAIDPGGGEEIHFQFDAAVALALGALPFSVVEGKAGGGVAAHAGFGKLGEEGADVVEEFDVGGGAGARGFPDRRLVDLVAVLEILEADGFVIRGFFRLLLAGDTETATHERRLAGAGDACENGETPKRNLDVEIVEIVQGAAFELEPILFGFEDLTA